MDINGVLKLDVHISDESQERIFQGAEEVLRLIRPKWPTKDITHKMLTDGITNKLVRSNVQDAPETEAVLIRIYGNKTDMLIDRNAEKRNIYMLNKFNLAPTLYATFKNGLAYQYVPGCTLTSKSAGSVEIYPLVARHLAKLHRLQQEDVRLPAVNGHRVDVPRKDEPCLWARIEKFIKLVPEQFTNEHINKKFLNMKLSRSQILDEIDFLKPHLVHCNSPIVFCHNDLLLGNVIFTKGDNPETTNNNDEHADDATSDKVTFIDFEYADFNYQAFDLGNHFAEFAGVDNVDYDCYPNKELQYAWLRQYAEEFHGGKGGSTVTDAMLDALYVQANRFALASHLLWGIWSLIQAEHSYIDFDFVDYAQIRLTEYFRRKDAFLALDLPNES